MIVTLNKSLTSQFTFSLIRAIVSDSSQLGRSPPLLIGNIWLIILACGFAQIPLSRVGKQLKAYTMARPMTRQQSLVEEGRR